MNEVNPFALLAVEVALSAQPRLVRRFLRKFPSVANRMQPFFGEMLKDWRANYTYLEDLYRKHLSPIRKDASVLFLGSGNGQELLSGRAVFPHGRLVALDKTVTNGSVATEFVTNTHFHQLDFTKHTPQELISLIDTTPSYVVCRHPEFHHNDWVRNHLVRWGSLPKRDRPKIMVTTFERGERDRLVRGLTKAGIRPRLAECNRGRLLIEVLNQPRCRADAFIATF